jgi:hypothetical protein
MIPYEDWQNAYGEAINRINALEPEMVTLGALRATSAKSLRRAAKSNGRNDSIFDYLTEEKDPSGFKYRIPSEAQLDMFRFAVRQLKGNITPALCKEDISLWTKIGLKFRGCHCLLGGSDPLVKESPLFRSSTRFEGEEEPRRVALGYAGH